MSDFGSSITLIKRDKVPITNDMLVLIKKEIEKVRSNNEFFDALGEKFMFEISEDSNDKTILHIILSEYWYGEDDDDDIFEFAQENDIEQTNDIANKLLPAFEELFEIIPNFDEW